MKARHVRPNDERGRPLHPLATPLDVGLCERSDDAGAMPIADPQLASVENPVRTVGTKTRGCLDVLGVGAGLGFGERVGSKRFTTCEHGQVARFLIDVAKEHDGLGPKPAVHADQDGHGCVNARKLAEDARIAGIRQSKASVLLRNREAEKAGARERAYDILTDRLLFVEARGIDEAIVLHGA